MITNQIINPNYKKMKTQLNAVFEFMSELFKLKTQVFLLICSVLCAHWILASTYDDQNTLQIMNIPGYTYSLVLNSLMVLVVAEVMCSMVLNAHRKYPALLFPKKHFYHRLKYAFGSSVLLSIALAGVYFGMHGQSILKNGFFHGTFLTDCLLIVIGNFVLDIYFFGQFFLTRDPAKDDEELSLIEDTGELIATEDAGLEELEEDVAESTAKKADPDLPQIKEDPGLGLIMIEDRKLKAFDKEGKPVEWYTSIKKSEDQLPFTYFSIDQSHIIYYDTIQVVWWSIRDQAIFVKLKTFPDTLRVARKRRIKFKKWCAAFGILIETRNNNNE